MVNWEDECVQKWLNTIVRDGTKRIYRGGFGLYCEWTGLSGSQLIDEAIEDMKLDPRQRKDVVKTRLLDFYKHLTEEHKVMSRGKGPKQVLRVGISGGLARTYVQALRSFYGTFDIYIHLKRRSRLPRPKVKNKRMKVNANEVKTLLNHARTPRDRAIILCGFQGGLDASTICSLTYEDVQKGLASDEYPLTLELQRPKTEVEYYTFLGRDAIDALKAYIEDAKHRGINFSFNTPLFVKERKKAGRTIGLKPNLIQNMLKEVAIKSGLVSKDLNGKDFNPLGPHALRESFSKIMSNTAVPDSIVDFWIGHSVGELDKTYKEKDFDRLKALYLEKEKFLSVTQSTSNIGKIGVLEQQIVDVSIENRRLKNDVFELLEWKEAVEKDREYIRYMKEEVKHFREGGIIIHYTGETPIEELRELVEEAKQGKLLPKRRNK